MSILLPAFYKRSPKTIAQDLLGKYLVYHSGTESLSAMITGVTVDPNPKITTRRVGIAFVDLNIKRKWQLSVSVGITPNIKAIVISRAIPVEGIERMKDNFKGEIFNLRDITRSAGSLCQSFGITQKLDSVSLITSSLCIEDRGALIDPSQIVISQDKKQKCRIFIK